MKDKLKSINFFIPFIFVVGMIFVFLVISFVQYNTSENSFEDEIVLTKKQLKKVVYESVGSKINSTELATELIINDERVKKLFAQHDREGLKKLLLPIFQKKLKPKFGIKQFQFHLPPAISFLRIHKINKYGDDLSAFRKTVVKANREKITVKGLEVGKAGLGLRIVKPVFFNGNFIGTMEFGLSFNELLKQISKHFDVAYAVGVKTNIFSLTGREVKQNEIIKNNIDYYLTSDDLISQIVKNNNDINSNNYLLIENNGHTFATFSVPLKDYSNNTIGNIIFAKDETPVIAAQKSSLFTLLGILFVIFSIMIVFLLYLMKRTVTYPLNEIVAFTQKLMKKDYSQLEKEFYFNELDVVKKSLNNLSQVVKEQYYLLDNLPSPVMKVDKSFNIEYMNLKGAEIVGSTKENLIGKKCYEYFKTEHCNTDKCAVAQAMKKKQVVAEVTKAHPQNKEMDIYYIGTPIYDDSGSVVGGMELVTDISEQKEAERYLSRNVNTIMIAMEKVAEGDLTVSVEAEKDDDEIAKLFKAFNSTVVNLKEMIGKLNENVHLTVSASTQISSSTEEMAAGAEEQSTQISEVASAIEEMTKTIVETAQNTNRAATASKESKEIAENGEIKTKETKKGMEDILESTKAISGIINSLVAKADQIDEITQIIDEIADQTNLLALNAAIEAARAGEHGRGFAVVADEVRKLAERTTQATKEIAETIKAIQSESKMAYDAMQKANDVTNRGAELTNEIENALQQIIESVERVDMEINQVATASEEQSSTAEQISGNVESISNVVHESAQGIHQIAEATENLQRLADELQDLINKFKIDNGDDHSKYAVRTNGKIVHNIS